MTTRNLTEVFILMRNNAVRNRQLYAEESKISSEHMQLVSLNDTEQGEVSNNEILLPPFWTNQLEDAHRMIQDIQSKVNELKTLHRRHLERSTFDESTEYEHLIEKCTTTITMSINAVHKIIQSIKTNSFDGSYQERRLTQNVVLSIAARLQEVSGSFRATQNQYLHQLKCMEERSNAYFDNKIDSKYDDSMMSMDAMQNDQDDIDAYFMNYSNGKVMSDMQLLYMEEENVKVTQQREEEINGIIKSIVDLNDIFKELSQMVAEHGTILDRIDYNIEQTHLQVYEGYKQLQKADAYSRKNRKMCVIISLALTTVLLIFVLILVKS